jgi:hypothetical protein
MGKKLLAALALALGMSLAQSYPYHHYSVYSVYWGFVFGRSFSIGGIYADVPYGGGVPRIRLGFTGISSARNLVTGITADVLFPLSSSPELFESFPYVGAGGTVWFLPSGGIDFSLHATLGSRIKIGGGRDPVTGFVEVQPGYVFGGGGDFFYPVKLGFDLALGVVGR